MRRKEKEITDSKIIDQIIKSAEVCYLGLSYKDIPYVVPLSFGYKENAIYLHSAKKGKKIDILKQNNKVSFVFNIDNEIEESEKACNWGVNFKSIMGFGKASFIEDNEEKQKALNIIIQNYTGKTFELPEKNINGTLLIKIDIEKITGKQSGY
jgi:uncharacterized protein